MSRTDLITEAYHGTQTNYTYGCRCDPCTEANTQGKQTWTQKRPHLAPDDPRHGTVNAYTNYGCRCDPCRAANSSYCATYRRGRKFVASRPPALEGDRAAGPPRPAAQPLNDKGKSC